MKSNITISGRYNVKNLLKNDSLFILLILLSKCKDQIRNCNQAKYKCKQDRHDEYPKFNA